MWKKLKFRQDEIPDLTEIERVCYKLSLQYERHHAKVFMVTSSVGNEGKTTIAALLAMMYAYSRKSKTVLIDCDLRRPRIHQIFDLPREQGVTDILSYGLNINSFLKNSKIPALKIITAGSANQNPSELFVPLSLDYMINDCQQNFSMVIIDAPPLLPVSDSILLSNRVEGILFVVKAGHTNKKIAARAIELLDENRNKVLGTVINNLKSVMPYYHDYRKYNYKYTNFHNVS